MTDKEKIMQCFNEILWNKNAAIKEEENDKYELLAIRFLKDGKINDTWFIFDKDGSLTNIY